MNGIRIALTHIGQGVFATQSFKAKESIGQVRGKTIYDPEYQSNYCIELGDDRVLEPIPPFRYLNHSCHPNCKLVTENDKIWINTIRPINPGDQLTIDYAWPAESAIPCACGKKNCRGWIVDKKELKLLEKQK